MKTRQEDESRNSLWNRFKSGTSSFLNGAYNVITLPFRMLGNALYWCVEKYVEYNYPIEKIREERREKIRTETLKDNLALFERKEKNKPLEKLKTVSKNEDKSFHHDEKKIAYSPIINISKSKAATKHQSVTNENKTQTYKPRK